MIGLFFFILVPMVGAEKVTPETNATAINTVWILIAAFLVFIVQAGFALVEGGFTRAKNAANIMMKNLMDFSIGSIAYWAVGFAIMFGVDSLGLFGAGGFSLSGGDPSTDEVFGLPHIQFLYLCGDLSARGPLDMG